MKWLTVRLGGQKWRVDLVKGNHKQLRHGDQACHGRTLYDDCKIYIAKEQTETATEDTLLHELLHAAFYVSRAHHVLYDVCSDPEKAERVEEEMIEKLVLVLHPLLAEMGFRFPKVSQ